MDVILGTWSCPFSPWRPADGRVFEFFSFDSETTAIDDRRPDLTPAYVMGAACDGNRGVFVTRDNLLPFFQAHQGVRFICHNASFDLRVVDVLLKPAIDVYAAVEENRVWDTLILTRLLSLATAGHTARRECGLADSCRKHLGIDLDKHQTDAQGRKVRTGFGEFLGKPPSMIPAEYLTYLGQDALATWHLFLDLNRRIKEILQSADTVYGFVSPDWLKYAISRFGPLTHHVQLRASILMDLLTRNGIGIDPARREEKARKVQEVLEACKERMRRRGFLAGEPGNGKALQSILAEFHRKIPDVELKRTESGDRWSTSEEDLAGLAQRDPFFADYTTYRTAEKLLSTYLSKMHRPRLHPKFGYLLETGRTYCGGGFNLQNLPKEKDEKSAAATVRGCFVPADGHVFIDSDFGQIELVVLAYVLKNQLGLPSVLAELVNGGEDVHRLIAGTMLNKPPDEVTKKERDSVKPVSFGRPGGMGVRGLRQVAKSGYRLDMTDEQVQQRIDAYHRLCPELTPFLEDEVDAGQVIAEALRLTPAVYHQALGRYGDAQDPDACRPQGWLGGMLLKVLKDAVPLTKNGRPYGDDEIDFYWQRAEELASRLPLKPDLLTKLKARQAGKDLWGAARNWAGRRSVFTATGRLRANTTFCSSRNTLFQGPAADGAILALWNVWRAGYRLVDFVHDQLVVEVPAGGGVPETAAHVEGLMKDGMHEVVPGMLVKVETVVSRSLNKEDLDPRYPDPSGPKEARHETAVAA